jgi:hypothetical protein
VVTLPSGQSCRTPRTADSELFLTHVRSRPIRYLAGQRRNGPSTAATDAHVGANAVVEAMALISRQA